MNEAIKLAVEKGGYKDGQHIDIKYSTRHDEAILDPLFWRALGKALGWKEEYEFANPIVHTIPQWLYEALWYHELNLTGGDTEKFWKELLK